MKSYISLEERVKILDENIENNKFVEVKLIEVIGLKIFENVYSDKRLPYFNKSAVDGYAIRIDDNEDIKRLKVIDKVFAGEVSKNIVTSKEAISYVEGKKLFWKINIKPGSAILASKIEDSLIISLSEIQRQLLQLLSY